MRNTSFCGDTADLINIDALLLLLQLKQLKIKISVISLTRTVHI